jgi:alpha-N-arabinofuranosidase
MTGHRPRSTVTIDAGRVLGKLDRRVFGGFVEHLGRCIYGGIYDEGSPLSDARGFRRDVLELLRTLRIPVLRWPGGNFVSNYHWQDGIGPKDARPARSELAWDATESNRFGTDEFIEYCGALGAEPYLCLNMGTGSLEEALAWVEYCNCERRTAWADLRRRNGHDTPFGVTWWGLGNEMYGAWQVGALSAEEYVAEATRWARAIRMLDPTAKLVSCGHSGWTDWDARVIDGLAPLVDLHSIHIYTGADDYWTDVLAPHAAERAITTASTLLRRATYNQNLPRMPRLAYDEWNVWFREMGDGLEERYSFPDALAVGTYLNIFVRNCAWVRMANLAQLVNVIAPVVTTPETAVVQLIYYPFLLHSEGHLDLAVDAHVAGETVDAPFEHLTRWEHHVRDLGPFQLVDAAATVDSRHERLAVTLVNRATSLVSLEIELSHAAFSGPASLRLVTASDRPSPLDGVASANVDASREPAAGSRLRLELPASSFLLLEAPIAGG